MFIEPIVSGAARRGRRPLRGEVRAHKRPYGPQSILLRIAEDIITTLEWGDLSGVRLRAGSGEDAGLILLTGATTDDAGYWVNLTKPRRYSSHNVIIHSSLIGRSSPPETITLPHQFRAIPGTDRFGLVLDVTALPVLQEDSHARQAA